MRVGQGYDVHRLVSDRLLILGGVTVPHDKGLDGHSDADVLLHAICDALLGAAALGDIGKHFPDTDERYAGANSRELLRLVATLLEETQQKVINIDSTIIAEKPKLAPYIEAMRQHISEDLEMPINNVSVKATTTEKLGFAGEGLGIAAQAIVLIDDITNK